MAERTGRRRLSVDARRAELLRIGMQLFSTRPYEEIWVEEIAELARLQFDVLQRLKRPDLRHGSIVTYASLAHVGTDVPDVNVTAVDRLADGAEDQLWAFLKDSHPDLWRYLNNIARAPRPKGAPMPQAAAKGLALERLPAPLRWRGDPAVRDVPAGRFPPLRADSPIAQRAFVAWA